MADSTVDIRTKNLTKPVDVADYLFTRLHQIGVRSVHGLPGDYNLVALDYLPKSGLKWVGSVNELNAAYAADGYARIKGISALITTFGVGELSALNGVAGAYSEMVPMVHIVGCPSTISQRNGMLLHHTLGNGDFNVFSEMSKAVSCVVAKLNDPAEIATQIDHALRECYLKSRPVYIMWPTDRVTTKVEGARLDTEIDLHEAENETEREDYVVDVVLRYLHQAKNPVLLVDACAIRHRVLDEVHALIEKTKIPVFVTPMGKGAIDETHESFGGVYAGDASHPDVKEAVESSDLVLTVGALKSDFNTAGFSYRLSQLNTVDFHSTYCAVRYSEYPGVKMRGVLKKVTDKVEVSQLTVKKAPKPPQTVAKAVGDDGPITQAWFWPRVTNFLKDDDIVVTETGTANFGIWDTKFPKGATGLNQTLWGSIGWAVGACQGAALGAKDAEQQRRTILFEGDGSFQLTAQEVSTMIRHQLDIILFVICNDGYTIERFIHGMEAEYNDVVQWDYKELVTVFSGGPEKQAKNNSKKYTVKTKDEVEKLFADKDFNERKGLRFVEIYMPKEDAPRSLQTTAEASAKNNAKSE
ncbi:pyruvate decarboxylase [Pestalotiopsis sp. NC0098]|nr:pyruvate decarboxylase [Pestalotiopsis sp. NC0098]